MRAYRGALWFVGAVCAGAGVLFACVSDEGPAPVIVNAGDGGEGGGGTNENDAATTDGTAPGTDAGAACKTAKDCPASAPNCVSGTCVECVPTADGGSADTFCAKDASTPFCGPKDTCVECLKANDCLPHVCSSDNACRACKANAECPVGACGDDGNCVAGSMVAYVDNAGKTAAACQAARQPINGTTLQSAYCDIVDAIGTKPYIVVIGHGATAPYSPFTVDLGASAATIIGASQATIIGATAGATGPAVVGGSIAAISDPGGGGSGAELVLVNAPAAAPGVTIDGFEITSSNMGVDGIHCKAPGAGHQLRVRNSYIHDVQGDGLHNANCDLTIEDNKVSGTNVRAIEDANTITPKYVIQRNVFMNGNGDGIYVGAPGGGGSGVDLTFDRNTVANYNAGNGLQIFGSGSYRITNSFFYLNERAFALSTNGNSPVKLFQFNTVVLNPLTGLFNSNCDNAVLESSIIVQNGEGAAAVSMCKQDHVVIDSDAGAPHFVDSNNASTYDFHLAIAKNADLTANTACCIDRVPLTFDAGAPLSDHDYDGTKRPLGAGYDIGAHEAK